MLVKLHHVFSSVPHPLGDHVHRHAGTDADGPKAVPENVETADHFPFGSSQRLLKVMLSFPR